MNYASIIGIALFSIIPGLIAKAKKRSFWGCYFLGYLVSPLVAIIIAIFLSKKEDYSDTAFSSIHICGNCGEKLIINGNFCRKCGTPVHKEEATL